MRSTKPTLRKVVDTEASGRLLAAHMLVQMETYEVDTGDPSDTPWPWSIEAMYRVKGAQQDNVILRFLDVVQDKPRALAGFCAALTDYIGSAACKSSGGTADPVYYKGLTERDVTGKPGPWPTMEDAERERRASEEKEKQKGRAALDRFMGRLLPGGKDARQ